MKTKFCNIIIAALIWKNIDLSKLSQISDVQVINTKRDGDYKDQPNIYIISVENHEDIYHSIIN